MIQLRRNSVPLLASSAFLLFACLAAGLCGSPFISSSLLGQDASKFRVATLSPASLPYIDAHTHIYQIDPEGAVSLLLSAMDRLNTAKAFIQTEPYGPDNPGRWDVEMILPAVKKHPEKLAVLGGGGTLNPMILDAYRTGNAGPEVQKKFRARAEELIKM